MCAKQNYSPIVVMIEQNDAADSAREWMEHSRFNTSEARDIFQALEEMGDFTTDHRPEVILLDVESTKDDLSLIRRTFEALHESQVPIMAISDTSEASFDRGAFEGNLEAVVAHLDELLPEATM